MAETVYFLCGLLSVICALLLFRSYRNTRSHLLLWSGVAFGFLALNNMILFADLVLFPTLEFNGALMRAVCAASAGGVLLFGLIWELS